MEVKDFIKRYVRKENYFYRLRGNLDKEQLLVYYYGVKMFEIKDNIFIPTIKFFLPNSKNGATESVPTKALEDYNNMIVNNNKFIMNYKNHNSIDYEDFYKILYTLTSDERQKVSFVGKDINEINLQELINIERILQSRIDNYSNNIGNLIENDFLPTTTEDGKREKVYQQKMMNILNDYSSKEKMNKVFKTSTYPLEMEYGFNSKEIIKKLKKVSGGKKLFIPTGRIDNICIDNNIVNMIEIKIGTPVIAGSNGIHKHLLDIAYCIKNKIMEPDDFNRIINERIEILDGYKIKNEINNCVDTLEYNIICGYKDDKEKQEVIAKLNKIYKLTIGQVLLMTKSGVESKSQKVKQKITNIIEKYKELANMNIEQLLEHLDRDLNCKTNIYISNEDYTVIEPYQYNNI